MILFEVVIIVVIVVVIIFRFKNRLTRSLALVRVVGGAAWNDNHNIQRNYFRESGLLRSKIRRERREYTGKGE